MKYNRIVPGVFISRPNRFIANVEIDGKIEVCHVKNTGRCKEILLPGAKVFLQKSNNPSRKTQYDLISVYKGNILVNIDSQVPNDVFGEWLEKAGYFKNIKYVKRECKFKNSRFDFFVETDTEKIFIEVKGVTLENDGVLSFPDAPTERGVKHLNELIDAVSEGFKAYVFFIIQMDRCKYFMPNKNNHPEFANTLKKAVEKGVSAKALVCDVGIDSIECREFTKVRI